MSLDETARTTIAPYVSSSVAEVFALVGLPEEEVAVLFAQAARSPQTLRSNLAKLLSSQQLESRSFREGVLHGYGHGSANEHAVVHLGLEGPSILASKLVEDARLASFTERLTRMAPVDPTMLVAVPEIGQLNDVYRASAEKLFATYIDLLPRVAAALSGRLPEGVEPRAIASDLLRGLLPAGTRTQLGLTANARVLAGLVEKLLSNPLAEARRLGEAIRGAAEFVAPAIFGKAIQGNAHRAARQHAVQEALRFIYTPPPENATATMVVHQPVRLLRWDKDALERVALALTYEGSDPRAHASGLIEGLRAATASELEGIIGASMKGRGANDAAPRGFEASTMTFELMLDYATYRDLQRHRLLSPSTQRLTCRLGFETPGALQDLGGYEAYADAMMTARDAWAKIEERFPIEAQYAVPIGYRVRTLWTLSLRELIHIVELRSQKGGHPTYRRIAQGMYRSSAAAIPWLKDLIRVDLQDSPLGF